MKKREYEEVCKNEIKDESKKDCKKENVEIVEVVERLKGEVYETMEKEGKTKQDKAEFITNISHDMKTPLTSIITYIDLIKRENVENDRIKSYIDVVEKKSENLKNVIENVLEIVRILTGTLETFKNIMNFKEIVNQVKREYEISCKKKNIIVELYCDKDDMIIYADGKKIYEIVGKIMENAVRYSVENSKIYINLEKKDKKIIFTIKNTLKEEIDVDIEKLKEKWKKGNVARTTEGSGLGLAIVDSLVKLHDGKFEIKMEKNEFIANVELCGCTENMEI